MSAADGTGVGGRITGTSWHLQALLKQPADAGARHPHVQLQKTLNEGDCRGEPFWAAFMV